MFSRLDESRVINQDTGEILFEKNVRYREGEIVKILNPRHDGRTAKFVKQMTSRDQKRILSKLNTEERAFLYSIQFYLQWETNFLVDEDDNPLTWTDVESIVGISRQTRYKLVRSLEGKNAIRYISEPGGRRVCIMMNPKFAYNGKKPPASLTKIFKAKKDVD